MALAALAASFVLSAAPASAQAQSAGQTLYQSRAGALDASGWTEARSTAGGFSVRLPCLYEDYGTNGPTDKADRGFFLRCDRQDGFRFGIIKAEVANPTVARQRFKEMAEMTASIDGPGKSVIFRGMEGFDFVANGNSACGGARLLLSGRSVFFMLVEHSGEKCMTSDSDIRFFFDSLTVVAQ